MTNITVTVQLKDIWWSTKYSIPHSTSINARLVIQFLGTQDCQSVKIQWWLQATYGNACMSKTMVNNWRRQFHQSCQSKADVPCSGPPLVATTACNISAVAAAT
jgi:hypothetical protein